MVNNIYNLQYPFIKYIKNSNKNDLLNLIFLFKPIIHDTTTNTNFEKFYDKYCIIEENWIKYNDINSITDLFTENIRVKCSFSGNTSPFDYWNKNKKKILADTLFHFKLIDIFNVRETIYKNIKLCNNFRITLALTILNIFKPNKWLDISAGWGDRLLSAIFYNYLNPDSFSLYYATDPNIDLHPLYNNIINHFVTNKKDRQKFVIKSVGFENLSIPSDDFDIVFSSPPFFDLEKYSEHIDDSLQKFNTQEKWAKGFLRPTLIKSYNSLKIGGHLILYINTPDYIQNELNKLHKIMDYKGTIYSFDKNDKKPVFRKMFVWKKVFAGHIFD